MSHAIGIIGAGIPGQETSCGNAGISSTPAVLTSRPTLPDSLPMIGRRPRHQGVWFNFGHQHIGLSTSTGSAELIADQIEGKTHDSIDGVPFAPGRFRA